MLGNVVHLRTQWDLLLGGRPGLVSRRLELGWPLKEALTIPAGKRRRLPCNVLRMHKLCSSCRRRLSKRYFDRDRSLPDGHKYQCRACRRAREEELKKGAPRLRPWQSAKADANLAQVVKNRGTL